jgi:hypothetical protein
MMLTLPASNVSVPLTVVRRTCVSVSDSVFDPETYALFEFQSLRVPLATHVFPDSKQT